MAKSKTLIPSILEAVKEIKKGKLKPVYYFSGDDFFGIDSSFKILEQKISPLLASDFDREIFYSEGKSIDEVLNSASSFPFGSGRKFVVVKESEKLKDKKNLLQYISSPPDFTVIVFLHYGKISNPDSEVYKGLNDFGYLFEAKELKGKNLIEWLINYSETKGKILIYENAQLLTDLAGEDRSLLETQLEKILTFMGDKKEIDHNVIKQATSALREYSIFDLQNSISKKDKRNALRIGLKIIESGGEPTYIIAMLTRYFTILSRINELQEMKLPDTAAARIVGAHPYYYKDYLNARSVFSDEKLFKAIKALFAADMSVKTTTVDPKNVIAVLIAEILA